MYGYQTQRAGGVQAGRQGPAGRAFQAFKPATACTVRAPRPQQHRGWHGQQQIVCQAAAAPAAESTTLGLPPLPPPLSDPRNAVLFADIDLPLYDPSSKQTFDLVVAGTGPAGLAVADRVSKAGFKVVLVDPNPKVCFEPAMLRPLYPE
jgi:hypothetical protein